MIWAVHGIGIAALTGCSALTSTTNTAADGLHTIGHGVSVSSRSSTNASAGKPDAARRAETRAYIRDQHDALRREAAFGGGEHIDALATLIEDTHPDSLGPWMQAHYAQLFSAETDTKEVAAAVSRRAG
ncbi:DUF3015 domain-containing protein [Salinisphaera sp. Q1T1-3]|nr:DUF3015 domain-containing protein [Salinisphaera sp. Q1T1-3]